MYDQQVSIILYQLQILRLSLSNGDESNQRLIMNVSEGAEYHQGIIKKDFFSHSFPALLRKVIK